MVTRWAKFERWARSTADDVPRSMVVLALINAYDWHVKEQENRAEAARLEIPTVSAP